MASKDQEQAKLKKRLEALLKLPGNQVCADCKKRGPRWASANLGIFFCIECSGIHRNLGVHISFVRSVNLDSWTEQQVSFMEEMGNDRANEVYEANMPAHIVRPKEGDQVRVVEKFIREKYEQKKFIAKAGQVPPKREAAAAQAPVEFSTSPAVRRTSITSPSNFNSAPAAIAAKPPAPAPKQQAVDLLDFMGGGGDSSSSTNGDAFSSGSNAFSADPFNSSPQVNNQALNNNDVFSGFSSAPTTVFSSPQQAAQQQPQRRQSNPNDLFGDFSAPPTSQPPPAPPKPQVSANDILSLYSQQVGQQMGGMQGFGGMNPQQMGGMQGFGGMPQQQGGFPMNPQMMGGQQMGGMQGFGGMNPQQMGGMQGFGGMPPMNPQMMGGMQQQQQQFRPNQQPQMISGFNGFPGQPQQQQQQQQQQMQAPQQAAPNPFASFDQFKRA